MAFVLDASSTLPWCFSDEATDGTRALLATMAHHEEAVVPALWPTEVLSSLLRGKRRGRVTELNLLQFLADLAGFQIVVAPSLSLHDLTSLKALSERLQISPYDAAYLDLAKKTGLPLATTDAALARACLIEGILTIPQ